MRKPRRFRLGRGVLMFIMLLLFASGLLRFSDEAGRALARNSESSDVTGHFAIGDGSQSCQTESDFAIALDALNERADAIEKREAKVAGKIRALRLAEQDIARSLENLEAVERKLDATLSRARGAAEKDVELLSAVYEKMKPRDAANVFGRMDPNFAVGFLANLSPEAAAEIFAELDPQSAYTISAILAGRNASVPRE